MNYNDEGEMRTANDTVIKQFKKGDNDYISVRELLTAAGLDAYGGLDGQHFSMVSNLSSFRYAKCILVRLSECCALCLHSL